MGFNSGFKGLRMCGSLLLLPLFAFISPSDTFTFYPQFNIPKHGRVKKSCSTLVFSCKSSFRQCFIHTAPPQGAGIIQQTEERGRYQDTQSRPTARIKDKVGNVRVPYHCGVLANESRHGNATRRVVCVLEQYENI